MQRSRREHMWVPSALHFVNLSRTRHERSHPWGVLELEQVILVLGQH